jgi:hypothetical protein
VQKGKGNESFHIEQHLPASEVAYHGVSVSEQNTASIFIKVKRAFI